MGSNDDCPICGGFYPVPLDRCINYFKRRMPSGITLAFKAYRFYKDSKLLPVSGGMMEQSAWFVNMVEFLDFAGATIEEEKAKHAERKKGLRNGH